MEIENDLEHEKKLSCFTLDENVNSYSKQNGFVSRELVHRISGFVAVSCGVRRMMRAWLRGNFAAEFLFLFSFFGQSQFSALLQRLMQLCSDLLHISCGSVFPRVYYISTCEHRMVFGVTTLRLRE